MPSTLNEFLEKALNEEFTIKGDPKALSDKMYRTLFSSKIETMVDYLDNKFVKDLAKYIKTLDKTKGKPKFGDMNDKALGTYIAALKKLEDKLLDFTESFDDARDEYGVSLFKDMKKEKKRR